MADGHTVRETCQYISRWVGWQKVSYAQAGMWVVGRYPGQDHTGDGMTHS